MKRNVNRLLSLALALVMLVGILPLTAKPVEVGAVEEEFSFNEVVMFDDFEKATVSAFSAYGTNQTLTSDWFSNQTLPTRVTNGDNSSDGIWSIVNDSEQGNVIKLEKKATEGKTACKLYTQPASNYTAQANVSYVFSFKCKVEEGSGNPCMYVRGCGSAGGTLSNITTEWQTISISFTSTSAKTFDPWFGFEGSNVGTVYFDDFQLEKVVDPYPVVEDSTAFSADFSTSAGYAVEGDLKKINNTTNFSYDSDTHSLKMTYSGTGTNTSSWLWTKPDGRNGVISGNTYTYEVWMKASTGKPYVYVGGSTSTSNGYSSSVSSISSTRTDGEWTVYTLVYTPSDNYEYLLLVMGLSSATAGDVAYFGKVSVTETWTYDNAIAYGQQLKLMADTTVEDIDLGEKGFLDLNGYTLTANFVDGTAGGTLIDSSEAKSGRVIVGTTDEGVDMLYPAANNPQLPVKTADGTYMLVEPGLTGSYIMQLGVNDNGFTLAARPGFGKTLDEEGNPYSVYNYVAAGTSGVSMELVLSWVDVYGQAGEYTLPVDAELLQRVYQNGSYVKAVFQNPGDAQYYDVAVVLKSCGVEISSAGKGAMTKYTNPGEVNKTYLFAHNFNAVDGINPAWNGSTLQSMRDPSKTISYSFAAATFDGTELDMAASDDSNQLNISLTDIMPETKGTLVIDMDVRYETGTNSKSATYFIVRNTSAASGSQYRQQRPVQIGTTSGLVCVYDNALPGKAGTADSSYDCVQSNSQSVGTLSNTADYSTLRIVFDYSNYGTEKNMTVTVSVDGGTEYTGILQDFNNTTLEFLRNKGYDTMHLDNLKIWYTLPAQTAE